MPPHAEGPDVTTRTKGLPTSTRETYHDQDTLPYNGVAGDGERGSPAGIKEASLDDSATADAHEDVEANAEPAKVEETPGTEHALIPEDRECPSSLAASDSDLWSNIDDASTSELISVDGDAEDNGVPIDSQEDADDLAGLSANGASEEGTVFLGECRVTPGSSEASDGSVVNLGGGDGSVQRDASSPMPHIQSPGPVPAAEAAHPPQAEPAATSWLCKVCNNSPTSPIVTMCGHLFCRR